jgi:hypothetical protein
MRHARDAVELVGISHERQLEISIVDFLYLYFLFQISPMGLMRSIFILASLQ